MKKALGRGLSALIPDSYVTAAKTAASSVQNPLAPRGNTTVAESGPAFRMIPIDKIQPLKDQPRKDFKPEGIEELAASIKEKGLLQPVIVTQEGDHYTLICGERRLRAAQLCGLNEMPAVVREVAPAEFLEWALIENIQREDLNPLEEAHAYERLLEEQRISQDELAKKLGKNRTTITNTIRLLRLPEEIQNYVFSGQLSAGHARALLGLLTPEHQRQIARRIVEETLSVRQVEALVTRSAAHKRKPKQARGLTPEIVDLENRLARHLGTQVKIYPRKKKEQGRIELHYYSLDDLDRILETIQLKRE